MGTASSKLHGESNASAGKTSGKWYLWLGWTGATFGGWLTAIPTTYAIIVILMFGEMAVRCPGGYPDYCFRESLSIEDAQLLIGMSGMLGGMMGILIGLASGLAQWLFLRKRISKAGWWISSNAIGAAIVCALIWTGFASMTWNELVETSGAYHPGIVIVCGALSGAATGLIQWLMLRRIILRVAWWILMSIMIWTSALSVSIYLFLDAMNPETGVLANLLIFGALVGMTSGIGLVKVLQDTTPAIRED